MRFVPLTGVKVSVVLGVFLSGIVFSQPTTLTWTEDQLKDYVIGSWVAKCASGAIGLPLEGAGVDTSRPLPSLSVDNILSCNNDDFYVMVPFIATMSDKSTGTRGIFSATMQDYADAFRKTTFELWWGNMNARGCLQNNIPAPYSGGWPQNGSVMNPAADAIDWQIECQFIPFIAPGMPTTCVKLDSICGHVIGYADGLYAGTLFEVASTIGPLYSDIHTIIKEALKAIPAQSAIHKNTDTLIWYHDKKPTKSYIDAFNWATAPNGGTRHCNVTPTGSCNQWIDAKQNAVIVMIAALWSDNDIIKALTWAERMGGDVDCNCGDVGSILGSMLGYSKLPAAWITTWNQALANGYGTKCSFPGAGVTGWNYQRILDAQLELAKKAIVQEGGTFANGVYTIKVQEVPAPRWFEQYGKVPVAVQPPVGGVVPVAAETPRAPQLQIARTGGNLRVRFDVPADRAFEPLRIDLLDQRGRIAAVLVRGTFGAGMHVVGCDARIPGCGIVRLRTGRSQATVRLVTVE